MKVPILLGRSILFASLEAGFSTHPCWPLSNVSLRVRDLALCPALSRHEEPPFSVVLRPPQDLWRASHLLVHRATCLRLSRTKTLRPVFAVLCHGHPTERPRR